MAAPAGFVLLPALLCLSSIASAAKPLSEVFHYNQGSYRYDNYDDVPIARSHGNVFPDFFVDLLAEESRAAHKVESESRAGNLKDGKAATWWAPMENIKNPRNAAEMAVAILYKFAFGDDAPPGGVGGGEWWVQMRKTTENIGFHVDKDEGVASEEQWMKMPILSTVTYLTDSGGPTFVMNMSTNRGGNTNVPSLPVEAALIYPKRNRHMLFRGDLEHGVLGELGGGSGGERITFLVNWWDTKPMAPYCVDVDDATAERIKAPALKPGGSGFFGTGGDTTGETWQKIQNMMASGEIGPEAPGSGREMPEDATVRKGEGKRKRVDVQIPPTKRFSFPLPAAAADGETYAGKVLEFKFDEPDVAGILRDLDPYHNMCMHLFNNVPGLKIVIFRGKDKRKPKRAAKFDLTVAYPVAQAYLWADKRDNREVRFPGGDDRGMGPTPMVYVADMPMCASAPRGLAPALGVPKKPASWWRGSSKDGPGAVVGAMLVQGGQQGNRFFRMPDPEDGEQLAWENIHYWTEKVRRAAIAGDFGTVRDFEMVNGQPKAGKSEL